MKMKRNLITSICCFFLLILLTTQSSVLPCFQEKRSESEDFLSVSSMIDDSFKKESSFLSSCTTMQTIVKSFNTTQSKPRRADNLPSSFSWTDMSGDWTSPVKDQASCGSCWDFAAIGLLESVINIREDHPDLDPDLSEQYVLSCLSKAGSCNGGVSQKALELIMSTEEQGNFYNGVPLEYCMPYQADDTIPCENKCDDWIDTLVPLKEYGSWDSDGTLEDRERIKTMILEKGPVISDIYASNDFRNWGRMHHKKTAVYPYEKPIIWSNHVVLIVGWCDDLTFPNGGYWICKNSWGKSWGYNGFFNIEYGGQGIDNGYVIWADYDSESYDWDPIARPSGPYYTEVDEPISFSGSNSFDVEDPLIEYVWDFGNNVTKTGVQVTHQYSEKGIYDVSLTVTDTEGNKDTKQTAVFIEPWKLGDSWTYTCNTFDIHVKHDTIEVFFQSMIPQLTFEIQREAVSFYEVRFYGELSEETNLLISSSSFDQEFVFSHSKIKGSFKVLKGSLSITDVECDVDGRVRVKDFFPNLLSFSFSLDFSVTSEGGVQLLHFPLFNGKTYDIPLATLDVNGTIYSRIFDLLSFFNTVADLFNKSFLPEPLNRLLPDIDVKEALDTTFGSNRLTMPCLPGLTVHNGTESVEAGTFPVHTISLPHVGSFSYSHSTGTIVQATINSSKLDTLQGFIDLSMDLELVDTTFEP